MEKRYTVWFGAAFIGTVLAYTYCITVMQAVLFALCLAVVVAVLFTKRGFRKCAVVVMCAVVLSILWQNVYYRMTEMPQNIFEREICVLAEAADYSRPNSKDTGIIVRARMVKINGARLSRPLTAIFYIGDKDCSLVPGDVFETDVCLTRLENTERFASLTYYKSRYVDVTGLASVADKIYRTGSVKPRYIPAILAHRFREKISEIYPQKTAPVIHALIMGDKDGLSASLLEDLKTTGLAHAISVSGMHISFLIGFILVFTRSKYLRLLAIPIMLLFALMVGAPQSALRAVIMQSLVLIAVVVKREYDSLYALVLAALILVAINPYCAGDFAFILSFSATLGIVLLAPKMSHAMMGIFVCRNKYLRRVFYSLCALAAVSVSAALCTAPFLAAAFGNISVISPISNIALNTLITATFVLGVINVLLGFIFMPLAKGVSVTVNTLVSAMLSEIRAIAGIPFAKVYTESTELVMLVIFLVVTLVLAIAFGRKRLRLRVTCTAIVVSVAATVLFMSFAAPETRGYGIRFDVLDVGQGQCVVASTADNCVVVDCGGSRDAGRIAAAHLRKLNIRRIDALILTHAHADHTNGAAKLLGEFAVKKLYISGGDLDNGTHKKLRKCAGEVGTSTVAVDRDISLGAGNIEISLLAPQGASEGNENGVTVLLCNGDFETVITGDLPEKCERMLVTENKLPDAEAYIVGHHGSDTSSSQMFLNTILPELSVISVGADNTYGHPMPETLSRLRRIKSKVYRTDTDGVVTFYSNGEREAA